MSPVFLLGLAGSLVLVAGAALPDKNVPPTRSPKDWCFGIGAAVLLAYSVLNYLAGAPVFFVFLEGLVTLASVLMMLGVPEPAVTPVIILAALGLVAWSLILSQGYGTLFFIVGLSGIAVGYVSEAGTLRRELALLFGSALIALFSYLSASWIFFWLNVFFAAFSAMYVWKALHADAAAPSKVRHRR